MSSSLILNLASPEETAECARLLGATLRGGDTLLLSGEIGAGKTHFARSLIQSLIDVPEDVPSPTFTLVQTYESRIAEIWHADLYRLSDADEVVELGLADAFETSICLVEWPDRLDDLMPGSALHVRLEDSDGADGRKMTMSWSQGKWASCLKEVFG
jgi:tRNA threonylcarbamoyladenosine biosynthesis protein TsaE